MADPRPLPRLLLLVAVTLGVAGMHTLGHTGGAEHAHAATARAVVGHADAGAVVGHADVPAVVRLTAVAPPGAGLGPVGAMATDGAGDGHGGSPLSPFSVCLAVLGALAVVVLLVVALRARPARRVDGGRGRRVPRLGRAPPTGRIGLRLTHVAVLRR